MQHLEAQRDLVDVHRLLPGGAPLLCLPLPQLLHRLVAVLGLRGGALKLRASESSTQRGLETGWLAEQHQFVSLYDLCQPRANDQQSTLYIHNDNWPWCYANWFHITHPEAADLRLLLQLALFDEVKGRAFSPVAAAPDIHLRVLEPVTAEAG